MLAVLALRQLDNRTFQQESLSEDFRNSCDFLTIFVQVAILLKLGQVQQFGMKSRRAGSCAQAHERLDFK